MSCLEARCGLAGSFLIATAGSAYSVQKTVAESCHCSLNDGFLGTQRRLSLFFTRSSLYWPKRGKFDLMITKITERQILVLFISFAFSWGYNSAFWSAENCKKDLLALEKQCQLHFEILLSVYAWEHYCKYGGHIEESDLKSQQRAQCCNGSRKFILGCYYKDNFKFYIQ